MEVTSQESTGNAAVARPRRIIIWIIEALLVLAIIGLLIAIWLPAWIGGRAGAPHAM